MLIVLINRNAFLVINDPNGRRSIIGISLAFAATLNRRFGAPVRRISLPLTSVQVLEEVQLGDPLTVEVEVQRILEALGVQ
ncbi:hypothetical protein [Mechercharimyces sp. CAU 1602]|uniref:hypothetical protein n=1 Tax=Mechercharimyces sp. CAU 1602 TaxID=2973933 RepID=UPI00216377D1|nr:hypothetical protein [Mechercharimyces sp. CAU 1602]MCS1351285.1 hypothetical protein [Mechercharimyces sp. CAU 1602]